MIICCGIAAKSQNLSVFNIDQNSFPTMRANFFAFNSSNQQIANLSSSDFEVYENSEKRKVLSISCPTPKPPEPVSSVLVMDASGSMGYGSLELAKKAARAWINGLPQTKAECAITCFDSKNYFIQDFTSNKALLLEKVNSLFASGSTDYDAAFLHEQAGGIIAASKGKYKRVIVLLSDGMPNYEPNTQEIIDQAKNNNITIYAVTLGMNPPDCLVKIAEQTGGLCFRTDNSEADIESIYLRILQIAQNAEPCTIEWESVQSCSEDYRDVRFKLPAYNLVAPAEYTLDPRFVINLAIEPKSIYFKQIEFPAVDSFVVITAINEDFSNVSIACNNPYFSVTPSQFSLQKGESKKINVRYTAPDSGYRYSKFSVASDLCDTLNFYVVGGSMMHKVVSPVKLTHPNGGEAFLVGKDTIITWEGVLPDEKVILSYSTDAGANWTKIADEASGLKYGWKPVPNTPSSRCLMKVQASGTSTAGVYSLVRSTAHTNLHDGVVNSVSWCPDGDYLLSSGYDGVLNIIRSQDEFYIFNDMITKRTDCYADWGDTTELTVCHRGSLVFYYFKTAGSSSFSTLKHDSLVDFTCLRWNPKKTILACSGSDNTVAFFNRKTHCFVPGLTGHDKKITCLSWSPDGKYLAGGDDDGYIIIWEVDSLRIFSEKNYSDMVSSISWSPDGQKLAFSLYNTGVIVTEPLTGAQVGTYLFANPSVVCWNNESDKLAVAEGEQINLLNFLTNEIETTIDEFPDIISTMAWNPVGDMICAGYEGGSVVLFELARAGGVPVADVSDSLWSIINVKLASKDIDMGMVQVNKAKDSVLTGFLSNSTPYAITAEKIFFTGSSAKEFDVVSGVPPVEVPAGGGLPVEFRFKPSSVGIKTAVVNIVSLNDTIRQSIRGEGVEAGLQVSTPIIDFGNVELLSYKDSLAYVVENMSSGPLTISSVDLLGPDKEQFKMASAGSFTLQSGEKKELLLKYEPKHLGRTTGQLGFSYNGPASPAVVQLYGTGIGGTVTVLDDSAYAGQYRTLKLRINNVKPEGLTSFASSIKAKIRFENTIIFPSRTGTDYMIENDSVCVNIDKALGNDSILAEIPVVAGLGRVSETSLDIVEFGFYNGAGDVVDYEAERQSGTFKLLGICPEGGNRLINPNADAVQLSITPQPATDEVVIAFWLDEAGPTKLYIADLLGNIVQVLLDADNKTFGLCTIKASVGSLAPGVYVLVLRTPTTRQSLSFIKE